MQFEVSQNGVYHPPPSMYSELNYPSPHGGFGLLSKCVANFSNWCENGG